MRNKTAWLDRPIKLENIIAFLLGLGICERISIALHIGSTDFSFLEIFSPIVLVFFVFTRPDDFKSFISNVPLGFKIFFAIILLSIFPGIIYFRTTDVIYRYLVGLISVFIYFSAAANAFILKDKKGFITGGILTGFLINLVFSVICFVSYSAGAVITLSEIPIFAREQFYVPVYSFRSQGFFLEPSHFVRFFASVILIVIAQMDTKNKIFKAALISISVIAVALSFSGSLAILAAGTAVYIVLKRKERRIEPTSIIAIFLVLAATAVFFATNLSENIDLAGFTDRILSGADITSEENSQRFSSMLIFAGYLDEIFLGCGWNLTGTLIEVENLPTVAAFSEVLQITVETGIVGGAVYVASVVYLICSLLNNRRSNYSVALAVSLMMILALQTGTDYSIDPCNMLVFGLAVAELSEARKTRLPKELHSPKKQPYAKLPKQTANQIGEQENADV